MLLKEYGLVWTPDAQVTEPPDSSSGGVTVDFQVPCLSLLHPALHLQFGAPKHCIVQYSVFKGSGASDHSRAQVIKSRIEKLNATVADTAQKVLSSLYLDMSLFSPDTERQSRDLPTSTCRNKQSKCMAVTAIPLICQGGQGGGGPYLPCTSARC